MSIFPPTDLIIDVDNAADPSKRSMAIQRLKHISSTLSDHPVNIVSDTHMTHFENSYRPASLSSIQERATPHQIHQDPVNEASSLKNSKLFFYSPGSNYFFPKSKAALMATMALRVRGARYSPNNLAPNLRRKIVLASIALWIMTTQ